MERKVIGSYYLSNTGSLNVYEINDDEETVLAGINNCPPTWCPITEKLNDEGKWESGFLFSDSFFIPFNCVERAF